MSSNSHKRGLGSLILSALISVSTSKPISSAEALDTGIVWKNCTLANFPALANLGIPPDDVSKLGTLPGLDCGSLEVPLDWSNPDDDTITLGMARYRATAPGKRVGSIVFNPGGPGGPGSSDAIAHALGINVFSNTTVDYYDVIGLDPRGVGLSTPVKCAPGLYNERVTNFPTNEADFQKLVDKNKALGESCLNMTGKLFYHLDTTSAARDVEAVRVALNEGKLNWIGLSYGTMLGAAYAELYPENVGRMLLDGNVDHAPAETNLLHAESSTYEDTLNQFFKWCNEAATLEECSFKGQNLPQIFDDLVASADKTPIPALGCGRNGSPCQGTVTGADILFNVQGAGYLLFVNITNGIGWPVLAQVLNQTLAGDATGLSTPLATTEADPSFPNLAIGCLDWYHNATTLADVKYKEQLGSYIAPHTKGASQTYSYQTSCIGWPAPVANPNHPLDQAAMAKAPPILMVNSYHDPETSYVWAQGLLAQIPSAVLLTRNGSGHTSYNLGGATAAAIDAFLADGTLPAPNTVLDS
ncbi:Alpha/Beta hydrolase protein [Xylogone sp. PMI_703]|nr:Alpha/Beta hydrolase protein [Xylogone sp. PMI_703]